MRKRRGLGRVSCALLPGLLLALAIAAPGLARAQSLVRNGAFTEAAEGVPEGWRTESWDLNLGTVFDWKRSEGAPGIVVIRSDKPNDARWVQSVPVKPETWYRLSGLVRAFRIPADGMGGTLGVMGAFDLSEQIGGEDSGWKPVALWIKTKPGQNDLSVACRLGGYGKLTPGEVWCTGIQMTAQSAPPLNANHVYGPVEETTTPVGLPAALFLVVLLLVSLVHFGRVRPPAAAGVEPFEWREAGALALLLIALLAVKMALAPYFAYRVDVGTYAAWANKLATEGPSRFYAPGYFADYPPGYMYVLWGIGLASRALRLGWQSPAFLILLKLPAMLADLFVARILFARLRPWGRNLAWASAAAFALNPALIVDSTIWGQTDSVLALLAILAFLAQGEGRFELAAALAAVAVLTKPQAMLLVPLLVVWPVGWWKSPRPLSMLLVLLTAVYVVADPFRGDRPWSWLYELYGGTAGYYAETSVNAMNFAALFGGMRQGDSDLLLGLTKQMWGFGMGGLVGLAIFWLYVKRPTRTMQALLMAWAGLVSFLFLTRMHERYLYPFFVFAGLVGVTGRIGLVYWALSAIFLVNEVVVFAYQDVASAGPDWLWKSMAVLATAIGVGSVWLLREISRGTEVPAGGPALDADDAQWKRLQADVARRAAEEAARVKPVVVPIDEQGRLPWSRGEIAALALLVLFSAGLRLWRLQSPADLVFDEVYFVEQARNYLQGKDFMDPHPPLAKLSIALGIALVGDTQVGWRIVNALVGTALVPLMYILARLLFRRRPAAFLAGLFTALDGLCLVDSRVAVIDIHYATWGVAAYVSTIALVLRREFESRWRLVLTGVLIGLSVGAKLYIPFFSFLLVLGTLAWASWRDAAERGRPLLRSVLLPVVTVGATASVVYVLAFLPHFLWGWWHSPLDLFNYVVFKVPEYQSAVRDATHPYASKWWTWPLLLRPVWYYFKEPTEAPGTIIGIWGSGNPSVWWAALPALALAAWHAVKDRRLTLGFVVAGWVIHLAPWMPISRTLFLYHYLPSLLFGLLALAWMLDRLWQGEGSRFERGFIVASILGSLLPVAIFSMPSWGAAVFVLLLVGVEGLVFSSRVDGVRVARVATSFYLAAVLAIAAYFMPIWLGTSLTRQAWQERMWISGSTWMNWI